MKIIIAGAGPAGLTFAYHAALRGLNVKVYEARKILAFKPCGEVFVKDAFLALPFKPDYRYKWILSEIKSVKIYYNGEYFKTFPSPLKERGLIINKRQFLQDLADLAVKEGAKIEMDHFYKPNSEDADLIVDATGYLRLSANISKETYRNYKTIPVMRDYAESNGILEEGQLVLDFLDKGYFWIFPYGKKTYNVGIGGFYEGDELKKIYEKKLKDYDLKIIKGTRQGASVSVGGVIDNQRIGKYYIIGEAAGFVMPTTGEGIRFSILSAYGFFHRSPITEKMKRRIMLNSKLLKLLLKIDQGLKRKFLKNISEDLLEILLGERDITINDILRFSLRKDSLLTFVSSYLKFK